MGKAVAQSKTIACRTCRYYQVTWDPALPYGCTAHAFKSKKNPSLAVFEMSGLQCQLYQPKQVGSRKQS